MWVCPKCGREFRRTNQGHYCGEPPETVLEYIKAQAHLFAIADIINAVIPGVQERISWSMPIYEKDGKSISFSACKNHVGSEAIEKFASDLCGFDVRKNAVYFPYSKNLPRKLIEDMVKWRMLQKYSGFRECEDAYINQDAWLFFDKHQTAFSLVEGYKASLVKDTSRGIYGQCYLC